jgi:hypothetical protein
MEKQKLLFHQARLADRGVAEMVLLHISASKGVPSDMVMGTLQLGISILRGGNIDIQMVICYIILLSPLRPRDSHCRGKGTCGRNMILFRHFASSAR